MAIRKSSNSGIPFGNTAGRPTAQTGQPYFNGEVGRLELYTSTGWQNIVQETPGVATISGNYSEATNSGTITISGTNFVSGAIASAIGTNGVEINAFSTTYNSIVQLTAVFTGLSSTYEPYDIKVTNPSNLFGLLPDALYVNNSPVWVTTAGSLGTFYEQVSISLSATATDSDSTITYSLASGSSLPSGITLNSSTGLISGTLPDISTQTVYSFTINATDGVNTIPRTFSITSNVNQSPSWSTSSGTIATIYDSGRSNYSVSVAASDPESATLTYSLVSGSLPTSMTLNTSTGVISGTTPAVGTDTTYSFTLGVSDGVNAVATRSFNIIVKAPYTQTFSYTGADQSWTVPAGVTSVTAKMWGAGGGSGRNGTAGTGAYGTGTISVTPGNTYKVIVGQGGLRGPIVSYAGGGGGGYAGIFLNNTASIANALMVVGGGGGAAGNNQVNGELGYGGGAGAFGGNGKDGYVDGRGGNNSGYGRGGTQSAGGIKGTNAPNANADGAALRGGVAQGQGVNTFGTAQYGGGGTSCSDTNYYGPGAGGAGYYGGGAGSNDGGYGGSGGGGSSYYNPSYVTSATSIAGTDGGNNASRSAPNNGDSKYIAGVGTTAPSSDGGNALVVLMY
jgi:hypothetical protein